MNTRFLIGPGFFRLTLAGIVFVHHISRFAIGHMAVMVFLVLSGYWITRMWREKYAAFRFPYRTFILSRVLRLLPVFVFLNILTMAVLVAFTHIPLEAGRTPLEWAHMAFSNIFIFGLSSLRQIILGSAWSLDIEMQFYLFAPLLILVVSRRPLWALVVAATVSATADLHLGSHSFTAYLIFFYIGIAAALFDWQPKAATAAFSFACLVSVLLIMAAWSPARDVLFGGAHPKPAFIFNSWLNVTLALIAAPLALFSVRQPSDRFDAACGDMSFIVYLVHWSTMAVLATHWGQLPPLQRLPYALATVVLTFALSYLVWRFVDRPLNRWRVGLIGRQEKKPEFRKATFPDVENGIRTHSSPMSPPSILTP